MKMDIAKAFGKPLIIHHSRVFTQRKASSTSLPYFSYLCTRRTLERLVFSQTLQSQMPFLQKSLFHCAYPKATTQEVQPTQYILNQESTEFFNTPLYVAQDKNVRLVEAKTQPHLILEGQGMQFSNSTSTEKISEHYTKVFEKIKSLHTHPFTAKNCVTDFTIKQKSQGRRTIYECITTIKPFAMLVKNQLFEFNEIYINCDIALTNNTIVFNNYPRSYAQQKHFFIFENNGNICYAGNSCWNNLPIKIGVEYEQNEKTAQYLSRFLDTSIKIFHYGFMQKTTVANNRFQSVSSTNYPIYQNEK